MEIKDAIIVGGGIAGLAAAWELREKDILLLESDDRFGGRLSSERRGKYWLNWGGHVLAGEGSSTDELLKSVGIQASPVPGTVTGIAMNGKVILDGRVESYPFRIPMSLKSRMAILKAGAKIRLAVMKYGKIVAPKPGENFKDHQQRIYEFENDQTFTDYVGKLPEDADAIFRPTVSRSAGDPEEISAGAGIGYFHLVWDKGEGLSRNVHGGAATLTNTLGESLSDKTRLGAVVTEVVQHQDHVEVTYTENGEVHVVKAKYAIMATPAPITNKIATNLDTDMRWALDQIKYGPYVSAAFLTNETDPQVWDDAYAIATPKRSFNVAFNMSNLNRSWESTREKGSSIMTFSPASLARKLIDQSDEQIIQTYLHDLNEIFPGFSDKVVEAKVQRFPLGLAYCFPGRAKLQPYLTKPDGRLFLAGDYLGTLYTETSIKTGQEAAKNILQRLS
ncbi:Protoporphyrinogen oxidase [Lentibacillus sp. JNUCC-1]|uniref:protoporphyrinogen/coproporphyrinogen oxidase n=1 Tax=Lentibacillus sp. JNUCC-1 TaxID=2654513 RepID=UPI0012E973A7|nr:NAD(P)/FAD-dependent oxidoreductase [Lentibacillus sp. JNUCC-1]MUV37017.1 Protoporphyrinogen oxidase [Lentibacillus sp. JNUCC-1]